LKKLDIQKKGVVLGMVHGQLLPATRFQGICEDGMMLAQAFVVSCRAGVDALGSEEPSDRLADITACYMALVEHDNRCDDCHKV
jgi:hypothetical protein